MYRRTRLVLMESLRWIRFRMKYRVGYDKVVIALSGENRKLDYYTMVYLENYVKRKFASGAVILFNDRETKKMIDSFVFSFPVEIVFCPPDKMKRLYDYYSFEKFFDNIVFTYVSKPKDNLLGRLLKETEVNEQDAVCLGLYHLRKVVELEEKYMRSQYA